MDYPQVILHHNPYKDLDIEVWGPDSRGEIEICVDRYGEYVAFCLPAKALYEALQKEMGESSC